MTYYPMIPAPTNKAEVTPKLLQLWQIIEQEILTHEIGEWEMWYEFDRMLAPLMTKNQTKKPEGVHP